MRILITGCNGTLGKPLFDLLTYQGHDVWGIDTKHHAHPKIVRADVSQYRELETILKAQQFDYVYHLAAEFGRKNGEEYYEQLWQTNAIGTRNILELQRQLHPRFNLIFASSSEVYGDMQEEWLSEDLTEVLPLRHLNDYAMSKWVNEVQCMNYQARYGNPIMRLRFFNAYGPGEYYHGYRSVVCLFCYRALHDLPYQVFEGYHRVFMFIDDFIPTLARAVRYFKAGEVYNIGGQEFRSVEELDAIVREHTDFSQDLVTYQAQDEHNVVDKRPDIGKAKADLGHDPRISLEEGVPKTLNWMREVYQ